MCLGIPGQVIEMVDPETHIAKVDVGGVKRNVNVGLLMNEDGSGGVQPGEWVLIHVGFAMSRIDEQEASTSLDFLKGMGQAYLDELEQLKRSDIA
jgi:hydrogenase expression/formation protein HypC